MKRFERDSGFTLMEIMVAVTIFAIIILAVGQASIVGQAASAEVKVQTNILLGCQQIMEQALQMPFATIVEQNGSTFDVRTGGPDASFEPGGTIVVDGDLNGNGTIETDTLYREGRTDVVRIALYFNGKLILQRVVSQF